MIILPKAKYLIIGGPDFIDFDLNYALVNFDGEQISVVGTAAVDALFVRPGTSLDFSSGASADKVYLTGNFSDYALTASGTSIKLSRNTGNPALSESVQLQASYNDSASDVVVFADGTVSNSALLSQIKTGAVASLSGETSLAPILTPTVGTTVKGLATLGSNGGGAVFSSFGPGIKFIAVGSSGVDVVYVKPGSNVEALKLGGGIDLIYMTGTWASYAKSISGSSITFTRTIDGNVEKVLLAADADANNDQLIFADGAVMSFDALTLLKGSTQAAMSTAASYDGSIVTPLTAGTAVPVITSLSNDSGISKSDFITNGVTQTVHGTFTGSLASGQIIQVSADGGQHWVTATITVASSAGGSFDAAGLTLSTGSGTVLSVQTVTAQGAAVAGASVPYTLDPASAPPTSSIASLAFSADTGAFNNDFVTNTAAQTVMGTLTQATQSGQIVKLSIDNGKTWVVAVNQAGTTSFTAAVQLTQSDTLLARVEDLAGNAGPGTSVAFVLDIVPPALTVDYATNSAAISVPGSSLAAGVSVNQAQSKSAAGLISFVAEAGSTVTIVFSGTGAVPVTHTVSATGSTQIQSLSGPELGQVGDGPIIVTVTATDLAGNFTLVTKALLLDTQAPVPVLSVEGAQGPYLNANQSSITLDVAYPNMAQNDSLQLTLNGAALNAPYKLSQTDAANGKASFTVSKVAVGADGDHVFSVQATDVAGNVSSSATPASTLHVTVDTVAPAPSIALTKGESNSVGGPQTTLNVAVSYGGIMAGDVIQLQVSHINVGPAYTVTGSDVLAGMAIVPVAAALLEAHDSSNLLLSMTATDLAGNIGSSNALSMVIDTTPPAASVLTLSFSNDTGVPTDFITRNPVQVINGTLTSATMSGDVVKISLDNGAHWQTATNAVGSTSFHLNGVTLIGSNTLLARVEDALGNANAAKIQPYTLETSAQTPGLQLATDTGVVGDGVSSNGLINVTGLEPGATFDYNEAGIWLPGSGSTFTLDPGVYGTDTVHVRQTDVAGNVSDYGKNISVITIESTADLPSFSLATDSGASNSDGISKYGTVTVSKLESGATWEYSTDHGQHWTAGSGVTFALGLGTHIINDVQVRQTDLAGNLSLPFKNPTALTIETAPPGQPTVALFADTGTLNNDGVTKNGLMLVGSLDADVNTHWQYNTNGSAIWLDGTGSNFILGQGVYAASSIMVRQVDLAGNFSAYATNSFSITVDTTAAAPTLTLNSDSGLPGDGVSNQPQVNVTGLESGATWAYSIDSGGHYTAGVGGSFNLTEAKHVSGTVQVTQTDLAGNLSAPGFNQGDITIMTALPPPLTVGLAVDSGSSSSDGTTKFGTVNVSPTAPGASWQYSTDAGGNWINGAGPTFSLLPGTYAANNVEVRQIDLAGNHSAPAIIATAITVISVPPDPLTGLLATDSGVLANDNDSQYGKVNVGLIAANATWEYNLNSGNSNNWVPGSGTSFTLQEGTYAVNSVQLRQIDLAGNISDPRGNLSVIDIDQTAPLNTVKSLSLSADTGTPGDFVTKTAAQTVSGMLTAPTQIDEIVTLSLDNGTTWTQAGNTPGTTSFHLPGVTLTGNYPLLARVEDLAGNAGVAFSQTYILDTLPPAITLTLTGSTINNAESTAAAGVLSINAENLAQVSAVFTGPGGTVTYTQTGSASEQPMALTVGDVATLGQGTIKVAVTATDLAGNASPVSSSFTLDTQAPVPVLTLAAGQTAYINAVQTAVALEVKYPNLAVGDTLQLMLGGVAVNPYYTMTQLDVDAGKYSISVAKSALSTGDGDQLFTLQATDVAGNIGSTLSTLHVLLDTMAPAPGITIKSGESGTVNAAETTLDIVVKYPGVAVGDVIQLQIGGTNAGPSYTVNSADAGAGAATVAIQTALLKTDSTTKFISMTATDLAGNQGSSGTLSITIDTTIPIAQLQTLLFSNDSGTPGDFITNIAAQDISGTLSAPTDTGAIVQISVDSGSSWLTAVNNAGSSDFHLNGVALLPNSNSLQVRVESANGNFGAMQSRTYVLDTQVATPTLTLENDSGSSKSDNVTNDGVLKVGLLEAGGAFEYNIGAGWHAGTGSGFTLAPGTYGGNTVQVRQTDLAGNHSDSATYAGSITIETMAQIPLVALDSDSGVSSTDSVTKFGKVNVTGLEPNATWEYSIDGGNTWNTGSSGSFTLAEGVHAANFVQVHQTDAAGNVSLPFVNYVPITIDKTAPLSASLMLAKDTGSSATDGITNNAQVNVTLAESGGYWEYSSNGGSSWSTGSGSGTNLSFMLPEHAYGVNDVKVRQTDLAGNQGPETALNTLITVDLTRPLAPAIGLTSDAGSNASDGITNNGQLTVSHLEANASWEYNVNATGWFPGTDSTFTLDAGIYSIGTVQVRQTDLAGNLGILLGSNAAQITVDHTPPDKPTLALNSDSGANSNDGITRFGQINVGNLEAHSSWQYNVGDGAGWHDGTGSTFTLTENTYTANMVQVRQTDLAGNLGPAVTNTSPIIVVLTAPSTPVIKLDNDSGSLNNDGISQYGTMNVTNLDPGVTWQYSFTGGAPWIAGVGGSFILPEGFNSKLLVMARATDAAGNISGNAQSPIDILVVSKAPAPVLTLASDSGLIGTDGVSNQPQINVGQLEAGAGWTYSTSSGSNPVKGTGSFFNLPDGIYAAGTVVVVQTDLAGNISSPGGNSTRLTIDTQAPQMPLLTLFSDSGVSAVDGITNQSKMMVDKLEHGSTTWEYSVDTGRHWSAGTNSSFALPDKVYLAGDVLVRQMDLAGNVSPYGKNTTGITVDTVAPLPLSLLLNSDTGVYPADNISNQGQMNVIGIEPGGTIVWEYNINNGNWTTGSGSSFTLLEGLYPIGSVQLRQTDLAGNVSAYSSNLASIKIDLTAPTNTVNALSFSADTGTPGDFVTYTAAQTVSGTLTAPTQSDEVVKVSLDHGATWTQANNTPGTTGFNVTGVTLTGSDTLLARVEDLAGNAGPAMSQAYILDTLPPAITLTPTGSLINNAQSTAATGVLSITAENLAKVSVLFSGPGGTVTYTQTGSASAQPMALTAGDVATLGQGSINVAGSATDLAGNVSLVSSSFTLDTQAPVPLLTLAAAQAPYVNALQTGVALEVKYPNLAVGDTLQLLLGGVAVNAPHTVNQADVSAGKFSTSVAKSALSAGDGDQLFTLQATDVAGNVGSTASTLHVLLDTKAPLPNISIKSGESATINSVVTQLDIVVAYTGLAAGDVLQPQIGSVNAGASYTVTGADVAANAATVAIPASLLTGDQNPKSIAMTATDLAGNSATNGNVNITVNTTLPTAVVNALAFSADSNVAGDFVTNVAAQTISGTLSAALASGQMVKISLDNGASWSVASYTAGATSFSLGGVVLASSNTLVARVEDAVGNPSASLNQAYIFKTFAAQPGLVLASDSGSNHGDGITNNNQVNVTLLDPHATFQYDTGAGWQQAATGSTSFTLSEGTHASGTVRVQQTDLAGNQSNPGSNTMSFTIDTIALPPTLTLVSATGGDGISKKNVISVTGLEANATWLYSVNGAAAANGTGGSFTLADGSYAIDSLSVTQTDLAGNTSTAQMNPASITINTVAPPPPQLTLALDTGASNADGITKSGLISVTGVANGASWEYSTDGTIWQAGSGTGTAALSSFSFTLLPSATPYAQNTVQVRQTDAFGNLSTTVSKIAYAITVDQVAPAAPTVVLNSDTGASATDGVTMDGRVNVSNLEANSDWEYSVDGGASWTTGSNSSFTLAPHIYSAGKVQVHQIDLADNTSAPFMFGELNIDRSPPVAPVLLLATDTGASASDNLTNNGQINVSKLESNLNWEYNLNSGVGAWTPGTGSSFTLLEGTYSAGMLRVHQTDLAGNISLDGQSKVDIRVDTTLPAAPSFALAVDSGPISTDGYTNNGLITVSGLTMTNGIVWQYSTDSGLNWIVGTNSSFVLLEGVHTAGTVQVRQLDLAGNTGLTMSAKDITIDTTAAPPGLVLDTDSGSSNSDGITNVTQLNVTGLEPGASWEYSTDTGAVFQTGTGASFVLSEGVHPIGQIQVRQIDLANNHSSRGVNSIAITIDTVAPGIPTLALDSDTGASGSDGITDSGLVDVAGLEVKAFLQYSLDSGSHWITAPLNTAVTGSFTVPENSYPANAVQVRQIDAAGNISNGVSKIASALTVDTTPPSSMTLTLDSDSGESAVDNITQKGLINVAAIDPDTVWQYSTDHGASFTTGSGHGPTGSFTLPDGIYAVNAVQLKQTDVAGNVTLSGNYAKITVDNVAPVRPVLTLASDSGLSSSDFITNAGTINVAQLELTSLSTQLWKYSTDNWATFTDGTGASFTLPEKVYQSNTVQVQQRDEAGNQSPIAIFGPKLTIVTTPPAPLSFVLNTDSGYDHADGFTNSGVINVSGMEAGLVWQYSTNGGTSYATGTGSTFTLAEGVYGKNTVIARETDVAGNHSIPFSNAGPITIKISAPGMPTLALATDAGTFPSDGVTNVGQINVGSLEPNTFWKYVIDGSTNYVTGSGTFFTLPEQTYAAGSIQVVQTDYAGNNSPLAIIHTRIVIDTTAPGKIAFTLPADTGISSSDGITNQNVFAVTGTEPDALAQFSIDNGLTWKNGTNTDFIVPDGTYAIGDLKARQSDLAGNPGPAVANTAAITIDTVAPTKPVFVLATDTGSSNSDGYSQNGQINVTGLESNALWQYRVDNGSWTTLTATGSNSGTFTLGEGTHSASTVQVRQMDVAGNYSPTATNQFLISIDNAAPTAPGASLNSDTGSNSSDGVSYLGLVNVTGLETGAGWQYSTDNGVSFQNGTGSSFILTENTYTGVKLHQTDLAGNHSTDSLAQAFTIDQTAPQAASLALASDSGKSSSDGYTNQGVVNVTALDGVSSWQYSTDSSATWIAGTGSSFTLGPNTSYPASAVQVRQIDLAGNIGPASALGTPITIDTSAPAAPTLALATDSGFSSSDWVSQYGLVNVTGLETTTLWRWEYSTDSGVHWATGSGATFILASGIYAANMVEVRQFDLAGNQSPAATPTAGNAIATAVNIDNMVPAATSVTHSFSGTVNTNSGNIIDTYNFNEAVQPLSAANFSISNGAFVSLVDTSGNGTIWQLKIAPTQGVASGNLDVTLSAGQTMDAAANVNLAATDSQPIDTVSPAPSEALGAGQTSHIGIDKTGVDIVVSSADMAVGDVIQMQLNGTTVSNLGAPYTVVSGDVTNHSVSMHIDRAVLGADGSKSVTAHMTDLAGNHGDTSPATMLQLVTQPELSSSLSGVTNLDVTSSLTLSSDAALTSAVSGKYIHIVEDAFSAGAAGYDGDTANHNQDIAVSNSMLSASGNKITFSLPFNLHLASNYHIEVDAGAFVDANGHASAAVTDATAIAFSTVTPFTGATPNAAPVSTAIDSSDTHAPGYQWWSVAGVGTPGGTESTVDLNGLNVAMVFKDYNPAGGTADTPATSSTPGTDGTDGIGIGGNPFFFNAVNFGSNDLLYINDQNADKGIKANANDTAYTQIGNSGVAPTRIMFDAYSGLDSNGGPGIIDITLAAAHVNDVFDSVAQLQALLGMSHSPVISA